MHRTARAAAPVLVALVLAACGGASSGPATAPAAASGAVPGASAGSPAPDAAAQGRYVDYATYSAAPASYAAGKVVLFFHATWCPDCRRTDANLTADPSSLPAGVTVVKVDYDSMTDLRQRYGVTRQWTFVSIGADGAKQGVWTGTDTGAEIAARV